MPRRSRAGSAARVFLKIPDSRGLGAASPLSSSVFFFRFLTPNRDLVCPAVRCLLAAASTMAGTAALVTSTAAMPRRARPGTAARVFLKIPDSRGLGAASPLSSSVFFFRFLTPNRDLVCPAVRCLLAAASTMAGTAALVTSTAAMPRRARPGTAARVFLKIPDSRGLGAASPLSSSVFFFRFLTPNRDLVCPAVR